MAETYLIWKVGSVAPSGVQQHFCTISGSRDIKKSKLDIIIRNFRYWLIFFLEFWCLILFCLYFGSLKLYTNEVEPGTYQRKDVSPPNKMGIARKIRNKSQWYQISRYPMDSSFKILEIWHPILLCLYLGSLISCRNVSVLQTELQIPPFKGDMSQPSSMFAAGDISQTILGAFFLGHPV